MADLRVGFDGYNLSLQQGTGVATYARSLTTTLAAIGAEAHALYAANRRPSKNKLLNYVGVFDADTRVRRRFTDRMAVLAGLAWPRPLHPVPRNDYVILDHLKNRLPHFDQMWLAHDLFHGANRTWAATKAFTKVTFSNTVSRDWPNVMHWTYPLPLKATDSANVYTVHDLVPLRLPFTTLDVKRRYFALIRRIVRKADRIACVSETTRRDLEMLFGKQGDRLVVTHQPVAIPETLRAKPIEAVHAELEAMFRLTPGRYFLFFGAIEPKKNVARLIEAYLASGVRDPLVIVGKRAWLEEQELALLYPDLVQVQRLAGETIRRDDRVRVYDYLPFSTLVSLIRGAKAVCFPSLYEGFGLPALEAMSLGTPVIASRTGALAETAAEGAVLVDPYDVSDIAAAIRRLDRDADFAAAMAQKGVARAQVYAPDVYAARMAAFYAGLV